MFDLVLAEPITIILTYPLLCTCSSQREAVEVRRESHQIQVIKMLYAFQ